MDLEIKKYLDEFKQIQECIINFVDQTSNTDADFQNVCQLFDNFNIHKDPQKLRLLLHLIIQICDYHHRSADFFPKIEQILLLFKTDIKLMIQNFTTFNLIKNSKRLLLFFIQNDIISIDQSITRFMTNSKYIIMNYHLFFFKEIKPFITKRFLQEYKDDIEKERFDENFEKKRKEGENDSYICTLIRNDFIDDFIIYVNQTNICLTAKVPISIFETNQFLLQQPPTLIEYAAFFGSTQIFNFLLLSNVKITNSLWDYAIHSNCADMIHSLEQNMAYPTNELFKHYLFKSIKCHHNDISYYLIKNYIQDDQLNSLQRKSLKYYNFDFIKEDEINHDIIKSLCQYDYSNFVKLCLQKDNDDLNDTKIPIFFS